MKGHIPTLFLLGLLLAACATSRPAAEENQQVPVYRADEKTPCEYEIIETVRVETSVDPFKARDYEAVRDLELGRAGAKVGADAVILPDTRLWLPFSVQAASNPIAATPFSFEGDAVSWIAGTCER